MAEPSRMSVLIRTLRKDCSMTQVQLAAALHVAPTSVHRWEAGTSNPDFEIAVSLWSLAIEHGSATSKYFAEFLAGRTEAIKPLLAAGKAPLIHALDKTVTELSPDQLQTVLAVIEMLKHNKDQTADQMLRVLLEPWRQKIISKGSSLFAKESSKPSTSRAPSDRKK